MASLPVKPATTGIRPAHLLFTPVLGIAVLSGYFLFAQDLSGNSPPQKAVREKVVQVRIVGNRSVPLATVQRKIRTRAGRPFDMETVEEDVRRLTSTRLFVNVKTSQQRVPGGRIVIFEVIERPTLLEVKYIGNRSISKKTLAKENELKIGEALDPFEVDEGRGKIESFYRSRGFSKIHVSVVEGDKPGDRQAIYVINEGPKQKVGWVSFVGNRFVSDGRLKTQIKSKPPIVYLFKGEFDRDQLEEDKRRLVAYYRRFGFFQADVGCEPEASASGEWVTLTFVVREGLRARVRKVSFEGNAKFASEELARQVTLKDGAFYNQDAMDKDRSTIREKYACVGYAFSRVQPEPRFLEEPGQLDLVYSVREGDRYRVGRISVEIEGENPHTRVSTVLDRVSLHTGEVFDIRKLRASERRLYRSGLFEINVPGQAPKIVFSEPRLDQDETGIAGRPSRGTNFRGQSPDVVPCGSWKLIPSAGARPGESRVDLVLPCRRVRPKTIWRGQNGFNSEGGWSTPPLPPRQPVPRSQFISPEPGSTLSPPVGTSSRYQDYSTLRDTSRGYPAPTSPADTPPGYLSTPNPPGPAGGYPPSTDTRPPFSSPVGAAPGRTYGSQPAGPDYAGSDSEAPEITGIFNEDPMFPSTLEDEDPSRPLPFHIRVRETQTGRFMAGVGINSDAGFMGSIVIDERNFDWARWPGSWQEFRSNPWNWLRGGGQRLRIEAVPGTRVQRYMINFSEPYLLHTDVSGSFSAFFYNRRYREYDEERFGGRIALGYQFPFRPDLTGSFAFRAAKISVYNPAVRGVPELEEVLGDNGLYGFQFRLAHDTRDHQFLATEGYLLEMAFEQVVGSYSYPRGEIDIRKYFRIHQRPDGSGRHVLSLSGRVGVTGSNTPLYDHYFIGGFSTIRGFDYRGASPVDDVHGVRIGGHFMMLAGIQYMFPITADDMLRAVAFCDTGTVEPSIDRWTDKYRIAPGFGLRITVPAMGPAPIALDFAFPISSESSDREEVFSFFVGINR